MLKKLYISALFLTSLSAKSISVAVAANVSYALNDLKAEFHKLYPDITINATLTSSGKLTAQIKNGANYEVFMSADMKYPKALYDENLSLTEPKVYARGSLAYLSIKDLDFSNGLNILKDDSVQKIAIANPKTAPYGRASVEAMKNLKLYENMQSKLVYAQTISQSVSYALSATDIGFVAESSLYSPKMKQYKKGIHWESVDKTLYTPIDQGIILLKTAKDNKEAKAFYDFILSPKAKEIFKRYGYLLP